ncbi:HK97 family phage prohead protease [Mobiluncus curtisii]|nr:HK97 family phage prohead protease [Mobiluncus curtisii]QQU09590.1 HK97 family phage prohead protease [Mobiluncus curtisii]SQB64849.1 phage prohead protease, HK97 family [Mobiluncus curtisii]
MSNDLEYRSISVGATDVEAREVSGIGVPFADETQIFEGYFEQFARGAVEVPKAGCKLLAEHAKPIGTLTGRDTERGWEIIGKVAKTQAGDEALELARAGVYTGLSVGFEMLEYADENREDGIHRTVTKALVREVSLTPFPAYENASVQKIRQKGKEMPELTEETPAKPVETESLRELRSTVEDLTRAVEVLKTSKPWEKPAEAAPDTRSAAEFIKSVLSGNEDDQTALRSIQERAYTGGTSADTVLTPQWVGDLTRLVDQGAGIRTLFTTGNLPAEGFTLEYAQLKSDTMKVAKQAKEGDNLVMGNVSVETKTTDISTFGGATTLSRQEIERGHVRILDHHLRAMAIAAGKTARNEFHTAYEGVVTGAPQKLTGKTLASMSWGDWVDQVVDAASIFEEQGLTIDNLIVDKTVFKALAKLEGKDGRPMMSEHEGGQNTIGTLTAAGLKGALLNIPVVLDTDAAKASAVFQNRLAIRSYMSSLVRLQDENILNLSKDFSVYFYAAFAAEMPGCLVPITGLAGA